MVWINEVKKPKVSPVHTIKCGASTKGWILCTEHYDVFLFKNSKEVRFIAEAMEVFIQNSSGREIVINPDSTQKKGFFISPGKECNWFYDEKSQTYVNNPELLNELKEELNDENPFLTHLSPSPLVPINQGEDDTPLLEGNPLNGKTRKASSVPR